MNSVAFYINMIVSALVSGAAAIGVTIDPTLWSAVEEQNLWSQVVGKCMMTLESLYYAHRAEVQGIITAGKAHTLNWYAQKALAFQYGDNLVVETDQYAVIDTSKRVIKYAGAWEYNSGGVMVVSLLVAQSATDPLTGDLICAQITDTGIIASFEAYMFAIKDAGTVLGVSVLAGDIHKCTVTIFYDAQVINSSGQRVDGTDNYPVDRAIVRYLNDLPFLGVVIVADYITAIRKVDGVTAVKLTALTGTLAGSTPTVTNILAAGYYRPLAGYMSYTVGANQTFTWTPLSYNDIY